MAKINEDDIDALRDKADIVDVISSYTPLKRSGGHTFKGLCPFHSEKTPSFTVDQSKGLYFCFGCGEGGNIYKFIEKQESLPFPEAVEWLARRVGYDLRYEEMRPGEKRAYGIKLRLLQANNEAADFFHSNLMSAPDALAARQYLKGRGFGKEIAERWKLGYAPGRDALCKHLMGKGFTREEIVQADLGRNSERDGSLYDTFRQRIMFPTWSLQGDVVGFGARIMPDAEGPKYLNSSETPVFAKSRVMYGLDRAKSSIARGNAAVVVEGYTDVIALHEAGIAEAVATNGVALGESHFEQLKKFASRAILMFDADQAGAGATERGFGLHRKIGLEVLVAPLPQGKDPADVVRDDGPEGLRAILDAAKPLIEFKLRQEISRARLDTPEARSAAVNLAVQVLGSHPDPVSRHEYVFMAAKMIGVDAEVVQRALSEQRPGPSDGGASPAREPDRRLPGHVKVEREALQLLLTRTRETVPWAGHVDESDFTSAARREIFRVVREAGEALDPAHVSEKLSPETVPMFAELSVGDVENLPPEELEERVREVFTRIRVFSLERDIKSRRNTLQDVNPLQDPLRHDELFTELVKLEAERRDLLRQVQGSQ
jgi:DNA primase